jgi:hypothetical protein
MKKLGYLSLWLGAVLATTLSCSSSDTNRKETFPLTGKVLVDGQPVGLIQVALHDTAGVDTENPTFSMTYTKDDGTFALSTYDEGDGVPAGDYAVTFMWGQLNMLSMQYGGPDKLKGKYSDPKKTPFKIKVEKGKPADLGTVELATS